MHRSYPGQVTTTPSASSPAPDDGRRPGDVLIRVGMVVFTLGALATVITFLPLFLGTEPFPTAAYVLSMLMGVGFALAGAGFLRGVAAQRRAARRHGQATPEGSPG